MKLFFLRRLLGITMVVDGFIAFFTPFTAGLQLKVARAMAKVRYEKAAL